MLHAWKKTYKGLTGICGLHLSPYQPILRYRGVELRSPALGDKGRL